MSRRLTPLFVLVVLAASLGVARADDPYYASIPAATCVPTRTTTDAALFDTTSGGAYGFKSGTTGSMEFTCRAFPFSSVPLGATTYVQLHYANDDDTSTPLTTHYEARLQLRRRNKSSGAIETLCDVSSVPQSGVASSPYNACQVIRTTANDYYFYANVTLTRDSYNQPQSIYFYGLSLTPSE